ncbi:Predicted arabinose efflux permease, MFS family [Actinomadura mexicana]|uniref:Predicted arabinose efflux permease, MFS family n=1 Tax=Actinomadura mexicana TaxID=134959 RepID=A0A239DRL9_9ACTN|nr:Predicted arabinose efflux permease, MFS family [Actinomadura mexicana]
MLAVAAATFLVVTSEMLPVGLLTSIGPELGVSAGTAGLAMTIPGLVAALSAPAISAATARLDRRAVLVVLAGLLAAADLGSAAAPGLPALLVSRVLVGVAIGGVWAIAGGLAARLVPERSAGTATSVIFGGIAVASVAGVPAGTLIGDVAGWRAAFAVAGALSLAACAALAVLLPALPGTGPAGFQDMPRVLRSPRVRTGLLVTLLLVTGHFAAYTYVRPVLERVSGVDPTLISTLLLLYGAAGIAGNFAAGTAAARAPRRTLVRIALLLAPAVLLFPVVGRSALPAVVLLVLWGAAYGGVSVTLQNWLLQAVPPHTAEPASALFVATFNIAISIGALSGGQVADTAGETGVMWLGGTLTALALALAAATIRRPDPSISRPRRDSSAART